MAEIMVKAGFNSIAFGLETGVDRIADRIDKGIGVEHHRKAVDIAKRHGMNVSLMMIYGFPTETRQDRETSLKVVQSMTPDFTKCNNLIPYPGTPLYEDAVKDGRLRITDNWSNFNSTLSITRSIFDKTPLAYVPKTTSEFELKRDIIRYNLRHLISLRTILSILKADRGMGWIDLPSMWWAKPREIYEIVKIGFNLGINIVISFLPLWISEPIMVTLNPAMKERPRMSPVETDQQEEPASRWNPKEALEASRRLRTEWRN